MKDWITSITSIILITTMFFLIMPEGRMGKYIKAMFSILIIFLIVQPIIQLKNNQTNYTQIFSENKVELQTNYINYMTQKKVSTYETKCVKKIEEIGVKNADVSINYQLLENGDFNIVLVQINLENSVIISNKEHIDILEEITLSVANFLIINEDLVTIYE